MMRLPSAAPARGGAEHIVLKDLNQIAVFVKVAGAKNFTEASHALGMTSSGVSKIITRLETELGARLFNRTTRTVQLTAEGEGFLESCREMLSAMERAEDSLRETTRSLKGTIRLTMPVGYGRRVISPALIAFASRYPDITLEAELSDRVVDLAYEPVDIAIVRGELPDARLIARRLCTLTFVACASPAYLERHGHPQEPEDLARHQCLVYMGPQMSRYRDWTFARNGRRFDLPVTGRINMNSAECLLEGAIAGLGIVLLSDMYTADAVNDGRLVPLLTRYRTPGTPISAVFLPDKARSTRISTFVDFLSKLVPPAIAPERLEPVEPGG
jgi:LysR family transcriptional regulator for bpeEF and oprC